MRKAHDESNETEVNGKASRLEAMVSSERATRLLYLIVGAAIIALVFRHLQFSTASICCGDFDGYYHIKWSQMLWEGRLESEGHTTPMTYLARNGKQYVVVVSTGVNAFALE